MFYFLQLSLEEYKDNTGRLSDFLFMWGKSNYMHGRSSPTIIMKILCLYIMLRYIIETIKHLNSCYFLHYAKTILLLGSIVSEMFI
jgi:hypothetical protein